MIKTNCSLQL